MWVLNKAIWSGTLYRPRPADYPQTVSWPCRSSRAASCSASPDAGQGCLRWLPWFGTAGTHACVCMDESAPRVARRAREGGQILHCCGLCCSAFVAWLGVLCAITSCAVRVLPCSLAWRTGRRPKRRSIDCSTNQVCVRVRLRMWCKGPREGGRRTSFIPRSWRQSSFGAPSTSDRYWVVASAQRTKMAAAWPSTDF